MNNNINNMFNFFIAGDFNRFHRGNISSRHFIPDKNLNNSADNDITDNANLSSDSNRNSSVEYGNLSSLSDSLYAVMDTDNTGKNIKFPYEDKGNQPVVSSKITQELELDKFDKNFTLDPKKIKDMSQEFQDITNYKYNIDDVRQAIEECNKNKISPSKNINEGLKDGTFLTPGNMTCNPSKPGFNGPPGSNRKIDYLIQDNHPEVLAGNGVGRLLEKPFEVPKGNHLLTSYHENKVSNTKYSKDKNVPEKDIGTDRDIVYNFKAKENNTSITFHRGNFGVNENGVKSGALAMGENFKDGKFNFVVCLKNKDGSLREIDLSKGKIPDDIPKDKMMIDGKGNLVVNLNQNETFNIKSPKSLPTDSVLASAIEFSTNKDITTDVRSVPAKHSYEEVAGDLNKIEMDDKKSYNDWKVEGIKVDIAQKQNRINSILNEIGSDNISNFRIINEIIQNLGKNIDPAGLKNMIGKNFKNEDEFIKELVGKGLDDNKIQLILKQVKLAEKVELYFKLRQLRSEIDTSNKKIKDEKNFVETPKHVSGVFPNPDYDVTGDIDTKENKKYVFKIPPDKDNNRAENADGMKNNGCFSQNFHYKLKLLNYQGGEKYSIVCVPGGGDISVPGQSNPNIASLLSKDKAGLTIPLNIVREGNEYFIEFDYPIMGGASTPIYATILKNN